MTGEVQQVINDIIQQPLPAAIVPSATFATGLATMMDWLPLVAGTIASILGGVASFVLIVVLVRREIRENQLHQYEVDKYNRGFKDE